MARILRSLTALLTCALLPAAAHAQDGEDLHHYGGIGVGWGRPFGQVSSMTDLVEFSAPVRADELYNSGFAIQLAVGTRIRSWILELSLDARIPRLTGAAQAIVDQTHPLGGKVDVEYASAELFVGRAVRSRRLSPFGGVGFGLAIMQLSGGQGVEPYNDEGVGGSAKVGVNWFPSPEGRWAFRLASRYQIFSAGVDLPNDVVVHVVTMFRF